MREENKVFLRGVFVVAVFVFLFSVGFSLDNKSEHGSLTGFVTLEKGEYTVTEDNDQYTLKKGDKKKATLDSTQYENIESFVYSNTINIDENGMITSNPSSTYIMKGSFNEDYEVYNKEYYTSDDNKKIPTISIGDAEVPYVGNDILTLSKGELKPSQTSFTYKDGVYTISTYNGKLSDLFGDYSNTFNSLGSLGSVKSDADVKIEHRNGQVYISTKTQKGREVIIKPHAMGESEIYTNIKRKTSDGEVELINEYEYGVIKDGEGGIDYQYRYNIKNGEEYYGVAVNSLNLQNIGYADFELASGQENYLMFDKDGHLMKYKNRKYVRAKSTCDNDECKKKVAKIEEEADKKVKDAKQKSEKAKEDMKLEGGFAQGFYQSLNNMETAINFGFMLAEWFGDGEVTEASKDVKKYLTVEGLSQQICYAGLYPENKGAPSGMAMGSDNVPNAHIEGKKFNYTTIKETENGLDKQNITVYKITLAVNANEKMLEEEDQADDNFLTFRIKRGSASGDVVDIDLKNDSIGKKVKIKFGTSYTLTGKNMLIRNSTQWGKDEKTICLVFDKPSGTDFSEVFESWLGNDNAICNNYKQTTSTSDAIRGTGNAFDWIAGGEVEGSTQSTEDNSESDSSSTNSEGESRPKPN